MPLPDDQMMTAHRVSPVRAARIWRICRAVVAPLLAPLLALLMAPPAAASAPIAAPPATPAAALHVIPAIQVDDGALAPGATTSLAITMAPQPGWHGYWVNGGDAGFGMQIRWQLPAGVQVGALAYPVPDTLVIAGLMNHVYEHPYALIAPLTVASTVAPGTRLAVRA
ncbi:MAG: protein-disulfide reductase DsbD domain-containing protein, partial [Sphingopyxis sp.]